VEVTRGIPTGEHERVPLGSGVLVSDDGLILTNSHVLDLTDLQNENEDEQNATGVDLEIAQEFLIYVVDSTDDDLDPRYSATVALDEPSFDLAVLQIIGDEDGRPLRRSVGDDRIPVPLAPLGGVSIRDPVHIFGYPVFGRASFADIGTTTIDVLDSQVRSLERVPGLRNVLYIHFDAIVSRGSSGGAVVDEEGQLVGVMAEARGGASGGSEAVAIPVDRARAVLVAAGGVEPSPTPAPTPTPIPPPQKPTPTVMPELDPPSTTEPLGTTHALTFQIGETVATTDTVNLRARPTTASPSLAELPAGSSLQITGTASGDGQAAWWPVTDLTTGREGFVREDLLAGPEPVPTPILEAPPELLGTGRLAYAAQVLGSWEIFVYNFATATSTPLTQSPGIDQTAPAWTHAGDRLEFISAASGEPSQVWTMNGDGTNPRQITHYTGSDTIYYVEWSPDDEDLIVTVAGGGEAWLMTVPVTGGDLTPFVPPPASHPDVSGDGSMVFVTVGGANLDLQLADATGNVIGTVAATAEWEDMPSISPDGMSVAYQLGQKGERRIAITSVATGEVFVLPPVGSDDSNPVWSPDGTEIALVATQDGRDSVWVVRSDGSERKQLDLGSPEAIWYLSWTA
jgi:hypothetical protein